MTPASRAWPFEGRDEGPERPRSPREFFERAGDGTEAVVVRIGLNDAQVVMVDRDGAWDRWVYHSMEDAEGAARELGVPVHVGEYPEELRVRINSHPRSENEWDRAYPEQGAVGPVIPYPENRPRKSAPPSKEVDEGAAPRRDPRSW